MKNLPNITRRLIILALATLILTTSMAHNSFAVSRTDKGRIEVGSTVAPPSSVPTPTPGPADDALLAYSKFDPGTFQNDIFRRRADGAGLLNLSQSPDQEFIFAWSPDGTKLAFVSYKTGPTRADIYVVNADGTNFTQVTNTPDEYKDWFAWSPDSTRLVFTSRDLAATFSLVKTINADGSNLVTISPAGASDYFPAWSPDGTHLSFLRFTVSSANNYVVNADGSNPLKINNAANERDASATWSADGTHLAFVRYSTGNPLGAIGDVYTVRPDGSDLLQLTNDQVAYTNPPKWSPNGLRLSFNSTRNDMLSLDVVNADGSGLTTIINSAEFFPGPEKWSPDGSRLVYQTCSGECERAGVYVVNADGTGAQQLGNDIEHNFGPDWSSDGARLAFASNRDGISSIDIINSDGTGRVDLTNQAGDYGVPKWRPVPQSNTPAGTNVTVTVVGVQLTFANVTQAGQTTATPIDPATAGTLPGGYTLFNGSLAFQITTTAIYSGTITVCIVDSSVNDPTTFASLRILHGEGGTLVDRTILSPDAPAPNFSTRTLCARVTSLSPFVIAKLVYGVQVLFDQTKPVKSGATLPVKLQLTNASGVNVSSASLVVTALSVLRVSTNTSGEVQDSGNANPDNNFRYAGGFYIYNLSTKGYAPGTYLLRFRAGTDVVNYSVQFQVK